MVLTDKQRNDLNVAVYFYLKDAGFPTAAETFKTEAITADPNPGINFDGAYENENNRSGPILEKKWTSVLRLQHKVMRLEAQIKSLQEDIQLRGKGNGLHDNLATLNSDTSDSSYMLSGTCKHTLTGHRYPILCTAFHPLYNLIATASEDATIKVWDFETGSFERTLKGHTNSVTHVAFDKETGDTLASSSTDLSIKLWNFKDGTYQCKRTLLGHDHTVSCVEFLKGGRKLVSCSRDETLRVWDLSNGYCLQTFTGHEDWVRNLTVNNESNMVASCSNDRSIICWNVNNGKIINKMKGHEHIIECVAFSSKQADKALIGKLPLLSSLNQEEKEEGNDSIMTKQKSIQGGAHLVSGSRDKTIRIWHVETGRCLMTLIGHDNWVRGVAFQPCGKHVISVADDKTIRIWDVTKRRCIRTIENAHEHFVSNLSIHPKMPVVATASVDTSAKIWLGV